jgi:hypothetical protein
VRVAAIQTNYVPWKGYFDVIHDVDTFVFYDEVQYTKNDWRNSNRIYTKNGLSWLTIPIPSHSVKMKISEVVIEDTKWVDKHKKTLLQGYASATCFNQLELLVQKCLKMTSSGRLIDVNRSFIYEIVKMLNIQTRIIDSKDFKLRDGREDRLLHLLKDIGCTEYVSGPTSFEYLEPQRERFKKEGIHIVYKDYSGYPSYRQLRLPFENTVSILDLLANVSTSEISNYIWGWRKDQRRVA